MAFISTMCDGSNPPIQGGGCNTSIREHPYSGVSSPDSGFARAFLGLPLDPDSFLNVMPPLDLDGRFLSGESGAMKTLFYTPQAGVLSLDWNKIGGDADFTYFSIWSDDPKNTNRINGWLGSSAGLPSGVNLCSRYYDIDPSENCSSPHVDLFNVESGWGTRSVAITAPGRYWIGFAFVETAEGSWPTVLALDNLRFQVPEPNSLSLLFLGSISLGILSRRRGNRTTVIDRLG